MLFQDLARESQGRYATGAGNRMSNDGVWTYTYDAPGNLTKKSKGTTSDT